jgi:GSH-dependent disulfide-bond oxidoreductase
LTRSNDGSGERPVVYTWEPNSNSGKPLFVLNEKGVEFDHVYIDLPEFEQHSPEYLAINPAGTVPALVHRGQILTESTPMSEYIDGVFDGPSLVPSDPTRRYVMRSWCRRTDKAAEALSVIGWHNNLGPKVRSKSPEELERLLARIPTRERRISWEKASRATFTPKQLADARAKVGAYVREMEDALAREPWLVGEQFTLADILTFANFYSLPVSYPEFATLEYAPRVRDWLTRIYQRPGTIRAIGLARSMAQRFADGRRLLGLDAVEGTT